MRFLSQQPDANFVALKCKPGAIKAILERDKPRFGCNSLKHMYRNFDHEQQFRYSAGANTLFSTQRLKAAFFLLIFKVSIDLVTIIKKRKFKDKYGTYR